MSRLRCAHASSGAIDSRAWLLGKPIASSAARVPTTASSGVTGSGIARSSGTSTSSDNIVTIESSRSVCSLLRVRSLSSGMSVGRICDAVTMA